MTDGILNFEGGILNGAFDAVIDFGILNGIR